MAYCGNCGRDHDPATPCAVADRTDGDGRSPRVEKARKLAKRVDWILTAVSLAVLALVLFLASR